MALQSETVTLKFTLEMPYFSELRGKLHFCYLQGRHFYQMEAHVFKNFFLRWDFTFRVRRGIKLPIGARDWCCNIFYPILLIVEQYLITSAERDKIRYAKSASFCFYSAVWRSESRISSRYLKITSISLIYSLTYSRKKELLFSIRFAGVWTYSPVWPVRSEETITLDV